MDWLVFFTQEWMLVGLLAGLIAALVVVEGKKGGKAINFHEVTRLLNTDEAVFVDVRDAKEYKAGHVVNAINIPHTKFAANLNDLEKYKSKTIIVADRYGQQAGNCGKLLREAGFNAVRLQGGMSEWEVQKLPVVKG